MHTAWFTAAVGFIITLCLSVGLIIAAPTLGIIDKPDKERKHHNRPTALTGGLTLVLMLVGIQATGNLPWKLHLIDWLAIYTMALVGFLDDRLNLKARYKALSGLVIACVLAGYYSHALPSSMDHIVFLHLRIPNVFPVTFLLLLFWFWSIPQALNLIDGINGLSMGFCLMIMGALGLYTGVHPAMLYGALCAILALNFPRARHFLGDCGALMLGTFLAILSVRLLIPANSSLPVWLFLYAIVDVSMVVAIRRRNGVPVCAADRNHLHYWMMDHLGNRVLAVTPALWLIAALPMARATHLPGANLISAVGAVLLVGLAVKGYLDRVHPRPKKAAIAPVLREHRYPGAASRESTEARRIV